MGSMISADADATANKTNRKIYFNELFVEVSCLINIYECFMASSVI